MSRKAKRTALAVLLLAAIVGAMLLSGRTGQGIQKLGDEVTK